MDPIGDFKINRDSILKSDSIGVGYLKKHLEAISLGQNMEFVIY